jgi:hypothetical protein
LRQNARPGRDERKLGDIKANRIAARKRWARFGVVVFTEVAVVGVIGSIIVDKAILVELAGVLKQIYEGRDHVAAGQTIAYLTAMPTRGQRPRLRCAGVFTCQRSVTAQVS